MVHVVIIVKGNNEVAGCPVFRGDKQIAQTAKVCE